MQANIAGTGMSRTMPRNMGRQKANEGVQTTETGEDGPHRRLNKNGSLQRSMSEVLRRKNRSESAIGRSTETVEGAATPVSPVTIPRRTDSKDPLVNKRFGELTPNDFQRLHTAALRRVNDIFKHCRIKPVPNDLGKTIQTAVYGQRRKWWTPWKKDKEEAPQSVLKTSLIKSLTYASIPVDPADNERDCRRIPILVNECIRYLKTHGMQSNGLFRVNGSEKRMQTLAAEFDKAPGTFEGNSVYDVADFMKKYLRGLPEPLFPFDLYPHLLKCLDVASESGSRIRALRLLILLLPPPHIVLLESLLQLFGTVASNSSYNQMNAHNLARIFSPNVLRPKSPKQPLEEYERCSFVVEILIDNWSQFIVSSKDVRPYQLLDVTYVPRDSFAQTPASLPQAAPITATAPASDSSPTPSVQLSFEESPSMKTLDPEIAAPELKLVDGIVRVNSASLRRKPGDGVVVRRVRTAPTKRTRRPTTSSVKGKLLRKQSSVSHSAPLPVARLA
ncbi:hypothetical protein HK097_009269 [Rhizophlyctis rosea]|uniref:Rho-GAP domain-containing protein n=1 Tax=Rhizophlyctis rosea TaxID=64517 RepID=A0AAD5SN29_9FUNG|nr:hypothetical protein HK097_009269 [Rhizophlyctis rosea]